ALEFVGRQASQHARRLVTGGGDDDEVAQALEQIFDEATRVLTGLYDAIDRREGARGRASSEGADDLVEQLAVGVAEQRDSALVRDRRPLGSGDQLVEDRQRVARRASAGAHDERQNTRVGGDALFAAQHL